MDSCDNLENTAVRRRLKKEWSKPTLYQFKYKFNQSKFNLNKSIVSFLKVKSHFTITFTVILKIIKVSKDNKLIAICHDNEAILFDITSCKESLVLNGIHKAHLSAFEFMYDESNRGTKWWLVFNIFLAKICNPLQ